jgi:7,8-dihydropterin-6-yl-methyl-4-(beta-D-ribofuranosyl)aminobenzene 5'-phosphate synthase
LKENLDEAYDRLVLVPVDRVEVTVVIDNFLDVLMAGDEGVVRYQARDFGVSEQLVAEHGFSAVVAFVRNGDRDAVLYDAGLTAHGVARNLDVLDVLEVPAACTSPAGCLSPHRANG